MSTTVSAAPREPEVQTAQAAILYQTPSGAWSPLPTWGGFFLRLGNLLASQAAETHRLVIGLAVPTRAFAASLIATGLVVARARIANSPAEITAHFDHLAALPIGTPLVYRRHGTQRLRAVYDGVFHEDRERRIRVKVEAGRSGSCLILGAKLAQQVEVGEDKSPHLPQQQRGKQLPRASEFLAHFVGRDSAIGFTSVSRLDCLVLGSVARICNEIADTPLAVEIRTSGPSGTSRHLAEGNLECLLRPRSLLPSGDSYRSDVRPYRSQVVRDELDDVPRFVTFDGAASYLHGRTNWQRSHCIVVLDRAERDFDDASNAFDQDYVKFRRDAKPPLEVAGVPPGIDLAYYEEAWP